MKYYLTAIAALVACAGVQAASIDVPVNFVAADNSAQPLGTVTISETDYGLLFTPKLEGLPPGVRGFHIHENPSCDAAENNGKMMPAQAAGGHLDPEKTGKHLGPYDSNGHLGDLPPIYITADGKANHPVLAPRLKSLDQVRNHSLMIHAGGDNYSDQPEALGGGGARIACGVIK